MKTALRSFVRTLFLLAVSASCIALLVIALTPYFGLADFNMLALSGIIGSLPMLYGVLLHYSTFVDWLKAGLILTLPLALIAAFFSLGTAFGLFMFYAGINCLYFFMCRSGFLKINHYLQVNVIEQKDLV